MNRLCVLFADDIVGTLLFIKTWDFGSLIIHRMNFK